MKKKLRISILIGCIVCMVVGISYLFYHEAKKKQARISDVTRQGVDLKYAKINQKLDTYLKKNKFNGTALVVHEGQVILNKGYGYADVQNKIKNTTHTKYRIGSITKTFVATSILQLQEQGKLNVQDNVHTYLPFFPEEKGITLQQLLTHTSGLPTKGKGKVNVFSHEDLVTWIGKQKLAFPPGTGWKYSDYNYMVLAYIVEQISGQSLEEYAREHIFIPAGLNETGMGNQLLGDTNFSTGYSKKGQHLIKVSNLSMAWLYGCGNVYTTVGDMQKLDEALISGKLFSVDSLQQMITPPTGRSYGFSFYIRPDYFHNHGVVAGWNTFNNFNVERQDFVILFSNVQNGINDSFNKKFRKMVIDLLEKEK